MNIEVLDESGEWVAITGASVVSGPATNRYVVVVTDVPVWVRLNAANNLRMRIGGRETFRTVGLDRSGSTMSIECLVNPTPSPT